MGLSCPSFGYCAKLCPMTETEKETLRVLLDEQLREDIARAREVTGIRSMSDLVRYALRQVARCGGRAVVAPVSS